MGVVAALVTADMQLGHDDVVLEATDVLHVSLVGVVVAEVHAVHASQAAPGCGRGVGLQVVLAAATQLEQQGLPAGEAGRLVDATSGRYRWERVQAASGRVATDVMVDSGWTVPWAAKGGVVSGVIVDGRWATT